MNGRVILLRHPPVALAWTGRCYGRSDMGLSRKGSIMARAIVGTLPTREITAVVHSDMQRTRPLAATVAHAADCPLIADTLWRERDFARWEGMSWNRIWRETGNAMDGMMTDPSGFRPGGGETSADVMIRAIAAWNDLPRGGITLVVTHGGPIAAIRTWLAGEPIDRMVTHITGEGTFVDLPEQRELQISLRPCPKGYSLATKPDGT